VIEQGALQAVLLEVDVALIDSAVVESAALPAELPTIEVAGNEELKTLRGCEEIVLGLRAAGATRSSCLLAVGGGTVQDAATFAASVYMRGIPWIYAPTTSMAMLDSCIGGKSSINAGSAKNLVGNIYPPRSVQIEPSFAATLTSEMIVSGLAEAVKICFAGGYDAFERFLELAPDPGTPGVEVGFVEHVLGVKRRFVEIDEFDRAERRLLNFGHTFGHALEAATGFAIPHGVAVAIGVRAAVRHPAAERGAEAERLDDYCSDLLEYVRPDVAEAAELLDAAAFEEAFAHDKKHTSGSFVLVLPGPPDPASPLRLVERPRVKRELEVALSCVTDVLRETAA
jgi:3-dehydroquinate synthase